jgi:hypothetical protein
MVYEGFLGIEVRKDPRTGSPYLLVFVTALTEELFDIIPSYLDGHTVVIEQIGVGRRIA